MGKMSVGLSDDNYEKVRKVALQRETSMAAYLNSILDQIDLSHKGERIVLSVPPKIKKEELKKWLLDRVDSIVDLYYNGNVNVIPKTD